MLTRINEGFGRDNRLEICYFMALGWYGIGLIVRHLRLVI